MENVMENAVYWVCRGYFSFAVVRNRKFVVDRPIFRDFEQRKNRQPSKSWIQ